MAIENATMSAEVLTRDFRYQGQVDTRGVRLADTLSDPRVGLFEMRDATIRPRDGRGKAIRCHQVSIRKNEILLAFPQGSHEAPLKRLNYHAERQQHAAVVVLPGYLLMGVIQLPDRATSLTVMGEQSTMPAFLAMIDVAVRPSGGDELAEQTPVAIFARESIQALYLAGEIARELTSPREEAKSPIVPLPETASGCAMDETRH